MKNFCIHPFLVFIIIFFVDCKRKPDFHCQSQSCIGNLTNDTIFYAWNSTFWDDTLLPGEVNCRDVGQIDITYNKKGKEKTHTTYVNQIYSSSGDWFVKAEKCYHKSNFEYDNQNPTSGNINLYVEE
jgi:hypothetical protein